jgi:hypothetical protein
MLIGLGTIAAFTLLSSLACASGTNRVPDSESKQPEEKWGIMDFPEPSTFTTEIVNLPNPFISWHGNKVTADNWDLRREEISQLLQHYLLGYKRPDKGFVSEIEAVGTGGAEQLITFKVTRQETGTSAIFYAKASVPEGNPPVDGWPVIMTVGTGTYNGNMGNVSGNTAYINAAGFVHLNLWCYSIRDGDESGASFIKWTNAEFNNGLVPTLFPETKYWSGSPRVKEDTFFKRWDTRDGWITEQGDPDAPGLMMDWVWGISRLIDALETENKKALTDRQIYLDPTKIAITGNSRMGKLSLFAAAFEPRISVSGPSDTCGGGFNIERFVSIAVNEEHSHMNFPHENSTAAGSDERAGGWGVKEFGGNWPPYNMKKTVGFSPFDGFGQINKLYTYMKYEGLSEAGGFVYARKVTAKEALIDPTKNLDGGVTKPFPSANNNYGHILWKGISQSTNVPLEGIDNDATNLRDGYGVHRYHTINDKIDTPYSPQTLTDIRWGFPNYWNERFHQFPLIFPDLHIHTRPNRGDWGYFANTPWDAHFISALIAPRPLIMFGGFNSENANSEGAFLNYLATREVYRLIGAEDNIGISITVHPHMQTAQDYRDLVDACVSYWKNGKPMPSRLRPENMSKYPFPINDPRSRYDYVKLNWAAPGYEPIADIVKRLVPANATSWGQIKMTED